VSDRKHSEQFQLVAESGFVKRSLFTETPLNFSTSSKKFRAISMAGFRTDTKLDFPHFSSGWPSGHSPEDIPVGDEA
jgi:hypothetical protein